MFTGIVEEIGTLRRMKPTVSSCTLTISCKKVLEGTKLGDSIAVNGTCLTVTRMDTHSFDCDVTPETLSRTSFSMVRVGSPLNLERALRLSDRLGGHIVLGHVDTTGRLISFIKEGNAVNVTISVEQKWMKYIIEKGSVAIDGVSLTVARREADRFTIALIPHTGEKTILLGKHPGDPVNVECDYLGKYVEQLMKKDTKEGLTMGMLETLSGGNYGI